MCQQKSPRGPGNPSIDDDSNGGTSLSGSCKNEQPEQNTGNARGGHKLDAEATPMTNASATQSAQAQQEA